MNLKEAVALLAAVSDFSFKQSEKKPAVSIYDNQNQGYTLCVKAHLINEEYHKYLKKTVEARKLRIRESEGYIVISDPSEQQSSR